MNLAIIVPFVVVLALVGLLAFVFRDSAGGKSGDRLDVLVGKRRTDGQMDLLKKLDFDMDKKTLLEAFTSRMPNLQKFFEQADYNKPNQLLIVGSVAAVLTMTGSWLAHVPVYFVPVVGVLMFLAPWVWLWNRRRARLKKFASQLPDALELVARALRAGHSLAAGMHVVAEEMPLPISIEFGRVYEEQNLGISLEDALRNMTERVPNLDLRFFVTTVAIQRQTGGDLSEILDKIGYVVRERYRILGQVKALTAEGRLSGVVLIALPFVLFLVMLHLKPDYVAVLWTDKQGIKMSIFALIMQLLGAAVIKKIVDIKV
ncbi:MAG TPA: type II secretion system F family protein [Gemmataceae bacterium]|nr:type II secretion system F family protein [Gemmataceae bacterium]